MFNSILLTDTHAHIHSFKENVDTLEAIKNAEEAGIKRIIAIGVDYEDSKKALSLAEKYDNIYAAAGVHPSYADRYSFSDFDKFLELINHEKVIAVGECGLDFYHEDNPSKEVQVKTFIDMIELSKRANKPLIIHTRNSAVDTLKVLTSELDPKNHTGGIFHCFDGSQCVFPFIDQYNFYISFAGNVTFKNAENLREALNQVPLEKLLIETDSPYLSPVPLRGKPNRPVNVIHIAKFIADYKNIELNTLADILEVNFNKLFFSQSIKKIS